MLDDNENAKQKEYRERRRKLNEAFVWTEENIKKLQKFNEHVRKMTEEAYRNLIQIKTDLEQKIQEGYKVYEDYDIDAKISPTEGIINGCDKDIAFSISLDEDWNLVNAHMHTDDRDSVEMLENQLRETLEDDWSNGELCDILHEHFQDVPMHYLTHHLLCHSKYYAYEDVINTELSDLRVWYKISL